MSAMDAKATSGVAIRWLGEDEGGSPYVVEVRAGR
jgi:hypothetical protein